MKRIWLAVLGVVAFVSLYPFDFRWIASHSDTLRTFLATCCVATSRGDILGNFVLFFPVGFVGMLAQPQLRQRRSRFALVLAISVFFALLLQIAQFYLPSRDQSLQDVIWNAAGTVAGAAFAPLAAAISRHPSAATRQAALVPVMLFGAWLAYRLFPFVPSIDLQLWKESVKPLFTLDLRLANVLRDTTAWAIGGYLLQRAHETARLDRYLLAVGIGVLGLEVVTVANAISASNVLGLLLGSALWFAFFRRQRAPEIWLLAALSLSILVSGLTPFTFRYVPAEFGWVPFQGFLGGSMYLNTHSALEKLFLYASFVYLCRQLRLSFFLAALAGASILGLIELMQTRLVGHTPEITDPLLLILAALGTKALEQARTEN